MSSSFAFQNMVTLPELSYCMFIKKPISIFLDDCCILQTLYCHFLYSGCYEDIATKATTV